MKERIRRSDPAGHGDDDSPASRQGDPVRVILLGDVPLGPLLFPTPRVSGTPLPEFFRLPRILNRKRTADDYPAADRSDDRPEHGHEREYLPAQFAIENRLGRIDWIHEAAERLACFVMIRQFEGDPLPEVADVVPVR